jgi:hypothetical protein
LGFGGELPICARAGGTNMRSKSALEHSRFNTVKYWFDSREGLDAGFETVRNDTRELQSEL